MVATAGLLMRARKSPDELLGELFADVQSQKIYEDGKTFVDLVPKRRVASIREEYKLVKQDPTFDLREFVSRHFYDLSTTTHRKEVFTPNPNHSIDEHILALWDQLEERNRLDRGSLVALPYTYVVPGGRFKEQFYWDSYFIMLGLAADGKWLRVEQMVKNFAFMIRKYGYIPTANRTYLLSRSQPPFFALMVRLLTEHKGKKVLREYLPLLLAEYRFWMKGRQKVTTTRATAFRRVVRMPDGSILNRYFDNKLTPRPESLREDTETASGTRVKSRLFLDLRAAAESGWDFSSRWFRDPHDIRTIQTTSLIPVDLNALLYMLEITIADAYSSFKNPFQVRKFRKYAQKRRDAMDTYLWNETEQFYADFNKKTRTFSPVLSLAAVFPLFVGMASQSQADAVARRLEIDFLTIGGLRTTLTDTGQQWDGSNGWAPLHWAAVQGLRAYGHDALADLIAERWLALTERVFKKDRRLVEKYNVSDQHGLGGGGEYILQDGFGWTNGVYRALSNQEKE